MTRLQARFRAIIFRFGEDFGGGRAVIAPLSPFRAQKYLSDADIATTDRPVWIAYAAYNHPANEGDTITWGARSLVVKRAIDVRFAGNAVARILFLATV